MEFGLWGNDVPIEYFTSLKLDLVYERWWGQIDLDQFRDIFVTYLADRHYRPGRAELVDLSGVTRVDLDFQRIQVMLRTVNDQLPGQTVRTRSVVWAPDDETFATGRMYQQLADYAGGVSVDIHREEAEALAACGLEHASMADLLRDGDFLPADPI